jgi:hypothetical protein
MGDDIPVLMEVFGCDYDAACEAVFSGESWRALSLLDVAGGEVRHVDMVEVVGTSRDPVDPPGAAQFTQMLAAKTAPVFQSAAEGIGQDVIEVVAVTYRNASGKSVHGGLYGVTPTEVLSLALKSHDGQVDTSKDPSFVAFGLCMMRAPLVFRQNGVDREMPLSIVDLTEGQHSKALRVPTPARSRVKEVYLSIALPAIVAA